MKISMSGDGEPALLSERVRGAIDLARPFTLLPPLLAGIFISMVPILLHGGNPIDHWQTLIYVGVTLALLQGAGQCINQSYPEEVKIDKINGKDYRPVPKGILTGQEAMGVGLLLLMFGITRAFTVNKSFGIFAMVLAFFTVFYTLPPVRAKKRPVLNILWLGISRGFLPVVACFAVFNDPFSSVALAWGSLGFVWVTGFNVVKDIPDMEGDKEYDIPSIPVLAGKFGTLIHTVSFTVVYICLSMYLIGTYLPPVFKIAYITWPFATLIPMSLILELPAPKMENNLSWVLFYVGLALLFLLPPLMMVIDIWY